MIVPKGIRDELRWFYEARFGMFVHFGLYSLLGRGEWAMYHEEIPRGTYSRLMDDFNPHLFDADAWVQLARDAGARNVYFASAAPPVRYPNVYGIDMPSANELIAHDRTVEEVRDLIGADWLVYQDLEDLIACVDDVNDDIDGWECSVFTGEYVTGDIDAAYLARLEGQRNDTNRSSGQVMDEDNGIIDLHNDED